MGWWKRWRRKKDAEKKPASQPAERGGTKARRRDEEAYVRRARERLAEGDLDGAIADCSKILEVNPDCVEAYAQRGLARERKGDLAGAKADYAKSLEIQIRAEIARQLAAQDGSAPSP
jgi:tetratricopeptide (TPR) repeat protein